MKLETVVVPRADGTVIARIGDRQYVFKNDEHGVLSCDVADEGDVKFLLDSGNFLPAAEEDFGDALRIQDAVAPAEPVKRGRKPKVPVVPETGADDPA